MIKALKIASALIFSVLILIAVFHSAIVKYALQKVVVESSKGKIELSIDEFGFNIFDGNISIIHPVIIFDDLFIDQAKTFKVEEIAFKEIRIEKLELLNLIFRLEIDAGRFLVDRPEFVFTEHGTKNRTNFQPKGFFDALKQNDEAFSDFKINIDEIEIHYGTVTFSANSDIDIDPGQVDFTINLENFSTHHDSADMNRLLYSDEFRFKLLNVHKILSSGYDLSVDSVTFSSVHRDLIVAGIRIKPLDILKDENTISLFSSKVSFNDIGLDDLRELKDLNLSSVVLSKTKLISYEKGGGEDKQKDTLASSGTQKLLKQFHSLSVDTLSVEEFAFLRVGTGNDTLIKADDINLYVTELLLDTSMYSDVVKKIGFDELEINTGAVNLKDLTSGLDISYEEFLYANVDDDFVLQGFRVKSGHGDGTDLLVPKLKIRGLSAHRFQKMQDQKISVTLTDPVGSLILNDRSVNDSTSKQKMALPFGVYLYQFEIDNGNVSILKDSVFVFNAGSIDLLAGGVSIPQKESDTLKVNSFKLSSGTGSFEKFQDSLSVGFSEINYDGRDLKISELVLEKKADTLKNLLTAADVELLGFDRKKLMFEETLYLDTVLVVNPVFNGIVKIEKKDTAAVKKAVISSVFMNIGKVILRDGEVMAAVVHDSDKVDLSAKYEIAAGPFNIGKGDTVSHIADNADWIVEMDSLKMIAKDHHIFMAQLRSSSVDSLFEIKQLNIHPVDSFNIDQGQEVVVSMLNLPSMRISGLDYDRLSDTDTIRFRKLAVESPDVRVFVIKDKKPKRDKPVKISLPVLLYREAGVKGLSLELVRKGENINKTINIDDLSFVHFKDKSPTGNVLRDILFSVKQLSMYDSLSHNTLDVKNIKVDTLNRMVSVQSISTGKHLNDSSEQAGAKVYLKDISFRNVSISDSLPLNIRSSNLEVQNVDVFITGDTIKKKDGKVFALRLKGLKNYRSVFASLTIDTADLADINFRTHTLGNLPEQIGKLDSISLVIEGIKIDSSMAGKSNPDIIERIHVDLNEKTNISADSLYKMHSGMLHYSFVLQKITVDSFYVTPLFQPDEFFERAKYQTDRIDLFVRKIEIDDVGFDDFLEDNVMDIGRVDMYDMKADIFRDKHYPMKPGVTKKLPQESLKDIKRSFNIDSFRVLNSYLRYREMGEKSLDPGEVFFDKVNISAYNITNVLKEGTDNDISLKFNSMLMGETAIELSALFPLDDDSVDFVIHGKTDKLDMTQLNPLTTNLLGIGIIKGKGRVNIEQITGVNGVSSGDLIFRYKNLRIHPYSRKKEKLKKGPLSPLIKFMINDLVVKSNNPKFARKPRVGQVYFVRDDRKGVVNYIWKSVLSGLMSTMGFNNKAQRKEKKESKAADKQTAALLHDENRRFVVADD